MGRSGAEAQHLAMSYSGSEEGEYSDAGSYEEGSDGAEVVESPKAERKKKKEKDKKEAKKEKKRAKKEKKRERKVKKKEKKEEYSDAGSYEEGSGGAEVVESPKAER